MTMIALALALAAAGQMPDLERSIDTYKALVVEAQKTGDTSWLPMAATNVCRIAYRYTLLGDNGAATDAIVAYNGPNADRLKLTCSLYFQARAQ